MLVRKIGSFLLACLLFAFLSFPVSAADSNKSGWIELLETTSIQTSGSNQFTVNGTSGSVSISLDTSKRLRKIDLLIWHPTGQRFSSATVTAAGATNNLDVLPIGSNLCRLVGYVPNSTYTKITVNLKKTTTSTQTYEVLSWRVTPIGIQEFALDADVYIDGGYYGTAEHITIPGTTNEYADPLVEVRISTADWRGYDSISIWGSATDVMLNSIRASIGTTGLDFSVSFLDSEAGGLYFEYDEYESGNYFGMDENDGIYSGEDWATGEGTVAPAGKSLFCITIDLIGADRATNDLLVVYLTGLCEPVWGYSFNCQYVNGSLVTADTTEVTWWNRITKFFSDLLDPNSSEADDFKDDAGQQAGAVDQMNQQLQATPKPDVGSVQMDVGSYVSSADSASFAVALSGLTESELLIKMICITLTVALVGYVLYGKR